MTLGVARKHAPGSRERFVMADGGEGIAEFTGFGDGVVHAVGGQQREIKRAGEIDGDAVTGFFLALEVALQFDVDIVMAEDADELIELASSFLGASLLEGCGERAFVTTGEADQAFGMFFEFLTGDRAFAFFGAQLHLGNQAAKVLVTGAIRDKHGKTEFTTETRRHGGIQMLIADF